MSDKTVQSEMDRALFSSLVLMLSTSAMQQLGKLVDPSTHKAEVNLEAAQVTIDMLEMIKHKTAGNLEREEERMLTDILSSLQMNFVQVSASHPAVDPAAPTASEPAPADAKPADQAAPGKDAKEPKFRKSYGA